MQKAHESYEPAAQKIRVGNNLFFSPVAGGLRLQIGVDEAVQLTVHHGVDVAGLIAGTVVLYQLVGHKHIRTDLGCPTLILSCTPLMSEIFSAWACIWSSTSLERSIRIQVSRF